MSDGREIVLDGSKQRTVLAALLMARGRLTTDQQLTDMLWECNPPTTASAQIYTYVSRLRKRLGDSVDIVRRRPGYLLELGGAEYDHREFGQLASQSRANAAAGRHEEALAGFRSALALWQDPPLADVTDFFAEAARPQLEEERMGVVEDYLDLELRLGRHAHILPMLSELVGEHPLREGLRVFLMAALFRSGRQADALATYERGRAILAEDLGVDPGPALYAAYHGVLTGALGTKPLAVVAGPSGVWADLAPAMLPPDVADFVGRDADMKTAADFLRAGTADQDPAVRSLIVTGTPGVGKSTLVLHAAHAARAEFPDGQLSADLDGIGAGSPQVSEVLGSFLKALGLDERDLPNRLEERRQLYRSRVADRRILLLLENVTDPAAAAQLLPAGRHSRVLICSRAGMTLPGAEVLDVAEMSPQDGYELLDRMIGTARVRAEPAATERLVHRCGGLPLALRIAGARLAARPHWTIAAFTDFLDEDEGLLDELAYGGASVRAAIEPSYAVLDESQRTALARVAGLDGGGFGIWAAATELGRSEAVTRRLLESLTDARLLDAVQEHGDTLRYRMHHLVKCFVAERSEKFRRAAPLAVTA